MLYIKVVIQKKKYILLQPFLVEVCLNLHLGARSHLSQISVLTTCKKIMEVLGRDSDKYI